MPQSSLKRSIRFKGVNIFICMLQFPSFGKLMLCWFYLTVLQNGWIGNITVFMMMCLSHTELRSFSTTGIPVTTRDLLEDTSAIWICFKFVYLVVDTIYRDRQRFITSALHPPILDCFRKTRRPYHKRKSYYRIIEWSIRRQHWIMFSL